jgi:hypothetical protein
MEHYRRKVGAIQMITVEIDDRNEHIQVCCDKEGVELLKRILEHVTKTGHEHLMTPSWAGNELSEQVQGKGNRLINHMTIYYKRD